MHCVDLGESFPTSIYLQNLASKQPRTSPLNFARSSGEANPGDADRRHDERARPALRAGALGKADSAVHDVPGVSTHNVLTRGRGGEGGSVQPTRL